MQRRQPIPQQQSREAQQAAHEVSRQRDYERGVTDADRRLGKSADGSESLSITGGGTKAVYHHLGRLPKGWRLVDLTADARVWRTAWDNTTITLSASNTCTVKVEVF